jgi:hypothetical protein
LALAVGLLWLLFAQSSTLLLVIAIALIACEVYLAARTWFTPKPHDTACGSEATRDFHATIVLDPRQCSECLFEAFRIIDDVIALTENPVRPKVVELEQQHPEIVDLFHEMLSATALSDRDALESLSRNRVPLVLRQAGLAVMSFAPVEDVLATQFFDLEPMLDAACNEPVEMYPAVLRGDNVVRRGRVAVPSSYPTSC